MRYKKWHNVGLFRDEDSAKILCKKFFDNPKYEARFSDSCNFGYKNNKVMLIINYEYWLKNDVYCQPKA